MTRPTLIGGGVQYHHQYQLNSASTQAINMTQYLAGVAEITGDQCPTCRVIFPNPQHQTLYEEALALCRKIGEAHRKAQADLEAIRESNPKLFFRCRKGLEPWPGELREGFEPICSCEWRCLLHNTQAPTATEADCNCELVCPRHQIPRKSGDRTPLLSFSKPDELLPVSLPTAPELSSFDHSFCKHQKNICLLYQSDEHIPPSFRNPNNN